MAIYNDEVCVMNLQDSFDKSLYVMGVSEDSNKFIAAFKDDTGNDVMFYITKSNFKKLVKAVEDFAFCQHMLKMYNKLPTNSVYVFDGVGQSIVK